MAHTLRVVADDIMVTLKQTINDRQIQRSQVVYWVLLIGNKLRSQHIAKRSSGMFLNTFGSVPVQKDTKGRKYFELPMQIYDYHNDRGIDYVCNGKQTAEECPPIFTRATYTRTTPKESEWLFKSKYTTPNPQNIYWYRTQEKIYLLGIEASEAVKDVEVGLYTILDPVTQVNIDEPFDFPEELLSQLKREVLDLGRFVLLVPEERKNDGDNDLNTSQVPTNKLVSVVQQPNQAGINPSIEE
jgi:hypothetical protein